VEETCVQFNRRQLLQTAVAATAWATLPLTFAWGAPPPTNKLPEDNGKGVRLGEPVKQKWRVGMVVRAIGGPCSGLYGTIPVPTNWPEQEIVVSDEELTKHVRAVNYRMLEGGVMQMQISVPTLPNGDTASALVTFEVFRRPAQPPEDTSILTIPKRPHSSLGRYLNSSPYIESKDTKIRELARELMEENAAKPDWEKVEALYDWVRDHVEYREGKLKGALAALKDKTGDCEELTSLFIALCRANGIPARTVWVPGHCYPEFYLEDDESQGHWIPCQIAGAREFGALTDPRPVLQKGDNFRVPEKKEAQRYVAEFLKGKAGGGKPQVTFHRDVLPAD
jgi:hypothetical protein